MSSENVLRLVVTLVDLIAEIVRDEMESLVENGEQFDTIILMSGAGDNNELVH